MQFQGRTMEIESLDTKKDAGNFFPIMHKIDTPFFSPLLIYTHVPIVLRQGDPNQGRWGRREARKLRSLPDDTTLT